MKICIIPVPVYISPHTQMILKTPQVYIFKGWTDSHNYIFTSHIYKTDFDILIQYLSCCTSPRRNDVKNGSAIIFFTFIFFSTCFLLNLRSTIQLFCCTSPLKREKHRSALFFFVLFLACISISLLDFVCIYISSLVHNSKVRKVLYKA